MLKMVLKGLSVILICASFIYSHQASADKNSDQTIELHSAFDIKDWPHWIDADNDCQDTRAEKLIEMSGKPVKFKRKKGCVVRSGDWIDMYTGRGTTKARKLRISHIVTPLEAYRSGADTWTQEQRRVFANDRTNLIPVSIRSKRVKGDKDPASWLPDQVEFRCVYLHYWLALKKKYELEMDQLEKDAITPFLETCNFRAHRKAKANPEKQDIDASHPLAKARARIYKSIISGLFNDEQKQALIKTSRAFTNVYLLGLKVDLEKGLTNILALEVTKQTSKIDSNDGYNRSEVQAARVIVSMVNGKYPEYLEDVFIMWGQQGILPENSHYPDPWYPNEEERISLIEMALSRTGFTLAEIANIAGSIR